MTHECENPNLTRFEYEMARSNCFVSTVLIPLAEQIANDPGLYLDMEDGLRERLGLPPRAADG